MQSGKSTSEAKLINIHDAARYLGGVSERHVWRLVKKGEIPVTRIGNRVLFQTTLLDRYIDAHTAFVPADVIQALMGE